MAIILPEIEHSSLRHAAIFRFFFRKQKAAFLIGYSLTFLSRFLLSIYLSTTLLPSPSPSSPSFPPSLTFLRSSTRASLSFELCLPETWCMKLSNFTRADVFAWLCARSRMVSDPRASGVYRLGIPRECLFNSLPRAVFLVSLHCLVFFLVFTAIRL